MLEEPQEESLVKICHLGLYKVPCYWKVKNSGWTPGQNSHEHKFERNINTPNPIKNVWYIKYCSLNSKEHINKCPSNFLLLSPTWLPQCHLWATAEVTSSIIQSHHCIWLFTVWLNGHWELCKQVVLRPHWRLTGL